MGINPESLGQRLQAAAQEISAANQAATGQESQPAAQESQTTGQESQEAAAQPQAAGGTGGSQAQGVQESAQQPQVNGGTIFNGSETSSAIPTTTLQDGLNKYFTGKDNGDIAQAITEALDINEDNVFDTIEQNAYYQAAEALNLLDEDGNFTTGSLIGLGASNNSENQGAVGTELIQDYMLQGIENDIAAQLSMPASGAYDYTGTYKITSQQPSTTGDGKHKIDIEFGENGTAGKASYIINSDGSYTLDGQIELNDTGYNIPDETKIDEDKKNAGKALEAIRPQDNGAGKAENQEDKQVDIDSLIDNVNNNTLSSEVLTDAFDGDTEKATEFLDNFLSDNKGVLTSCLDIRDTDVKTVYENEEYAVKTKEGEEPVNVDLGWAFKEFVDANLKSSVDKLESYATSNKTEEEADATSAKATDEAENQEDKQVDFNSLIDNINNNTLSSEVLTDAFGSEERAIEFLDDFLSDNKDNLVERSILPNEDFSADCEEGKYVIKSGDSDDDYKFYLDDTTVNRNVIWGLQDNIDYLEAKADATSAKATDEAENQEDEARAEAEAGEEAEVGEAIATNVTTAAIEACIAHREAAATDGTTEDAGEKAEAGKEKVAGAAAGVAEADATDTEAGKGKVAGAAAGVAEADAIDGEEAAATDGTEAGEEAEADNVQTTTETNDDGTVVTTEVHKDSSGNITGKTIDKTYTNGDISHGEAKFENGKCTEAETDHTYANGDVKHTIDTYENGKRTKSDSEYTYANGDEKYNESTTYTYDESGKCTESTTSRTYANGDVKHTIDTYENGKRTKSDSEYTYANGDTEHTESTYTYDEDGNYTGKTVEKTLANGDKEYTTYDKDGKEISPSTTTSSEGSNLKAQETVTTTDATVDATDAAADAEKVQEADDATDDDSDDVDNEKELSFAEQQVASANKTIADNTSFIMECMFKLDLGDDLSGLSECEINEKYVNLTDPNSPREEARLADYEISGEKFREFLGAAYKKTYPETGFASEATVDIARCIRGEDGNLEDIDGNVIQPNAQSLKDNAREIEDGTYPAIGDIVVTSNEDGNNFHSGVVVGYTEDEPPRAIVMEANSMKTSDQHGTTLAVYDFNSDTEKSIRGYIPLSQDATSIIIEDPSKGSDDLGGDNAQGGSKDDSDGSETDSSNAKQPTTAQRTYSNVMPNATDEQRASIDKLALRTDISKYTADDGGNIIVTFNDGSTTTYNQAGQITGLDADSAKELISSEQKSAVSRTLGFNNTKNATYDYNPATREVTVTSNGNKYVVDSKGNVVDSKGIAIAPDGNITSASEAGGKQSGETPVLDEMQKGALTQLGISEEEFFARTPEEQQHIWDVLQKYQGKLEPGITIDGILSKEV